MQTPFVFSVLFFSFPCKLVLLSSLLVSFIGSLSRVLFFPPSVIMRSFLISCLLYRLTTLASHYTIVLHSWHILFPLKLPKTYPHLSINSWICEVCPYLAFGVFMSFLPLPWFLIQPVLLGVKELRAVRSSTRFLHIIHSLFNVPQQLLGINCTCLCRAYEYYYIRFRQCLVEGPCTSSDRFDWDWMLLEGMIYFTV